MKKLKKYYFLQKAKELSEETINELVCPTWDTNLSSEDIKELKEYIDKML